MDPHFGSVFRSRIGFWLEKLDLDSECKISRYAHLSSSSEKTSPWWRAVGDTVFDLNGPVGEVLQF